MRVRFSVLLRKNIEGIAKRIESAGFLRYFAFVRKPNAAVPLYADAFGLLRFGAPSISASLSKRIFDRLKESPCGGPFFML